MAKTSCVLLAMLLSAPSAVKGSDAMEMPKPIQIVLDNAKPLTHPRGDRLPLLLWPVLHGVVDDEAQQEAIIRALDERGVALMATWNYDSKDKSLPDSMRVARIQQKLGVPVIVNANPCMYRFFNGDEQTAHVDADGKRFFDDSFGDHHKMGCAFAADYRYADMKERIDFFVRAYKEAGLPLDMVWGDWEIDGAHEFNRSWEAAKRCAVCRQNIPELDDFAAYQKVMRIKRADMTRKCYTEPILSRYAKAIVGNYGVYPHNGYRYWYDYFEFFVDYQPHIKDQRARYRKWYDEFDLTGYTFAMPVVYTWYDTFGWYDFDDPDYRWFYNMLLVASNAGEHTDASVPIIPFVHWHLILEVPGRDITPDESVKQMSERAYQELLWHMLLRGTDGLFLWAREHEWGKETQLLHEVYAASLEYADWLNEGVPINFEVPKQPGVVISGLRRGDRVLVRRTDFGKAEAKPVTIEVAGRKLTVLPAPGKCQILEIH